MDVRHDVMTNFPLLGFGCFEVDIVDVGAHFFEGDFADQVVETELCFGFGQGDPASSPGRELCLLREDFLHGSAGVSTDEWFSIDIPVHGVVLLLSEVNLRFFLFLDKRVIRCNLSGTKLPNSASGRMGCSDTVK
jgi:hypothetical protein